MAARSARTLEALLDRLCTDQLRLKILIVDIKNGYHRARIVGINCSFSHKQKSAIVQVVDQLKGLKHGAKIGGKVIRRNLITQIKRANLQVLLVYIYCVPADEAAEDLAFVLEHFDG